MRAALMKAVVLSILKKRDMKEEKKDNESHSKGLTRRDFCRTAAAGIAALSSDARHALSKTRTKSMALTIPFDYTPRCPQPGSLFTEQSFVRKSVPFTFDISEVGIALVDLWNFGWEGGPVSAALGPELSLERGVSHAQRKRQITEKVIQPTVEELRNLGVQVFHCTAWQILSRYPQWTASTTEAERELLKPKPQSGNAAPVNQGKDDIKEMWPPADWVQSWKEKHTDLVFGNEWIAQRGRDLYGPNLKFDIAAPVRPHDGDLLVYHSREQFHRLLTEKKIRVLIYMGFESDDCVQFQPYGIANMQDIGYLCAVVRDATTTYETAETLAGQWKTKVSIDAIEERWGYSVTSEVLRQSIRAAKT